MPREGNSLVGEMDGAGLKYVDVIVNGQPVQALLDTGSSMSLIRESLVSEGNIDYSRRTTISCKCIC